jgi:phospholipase/carboxylesterase
MDLIHSTLTHKILIPERRGTERYPAVMMIHGRGADENDLLGLAEYLDDRLFVISVRAPFPFQYGGGFAWYDVIEVGTPEPRMFAESYRKLSQFIDDARTGYPIDPTKLVLLGFSMGSIMSLAIALSKPDSVLAVAAHSGYVPEGTDLEFQWNGIAGKPFFVAHGVYDPVIPVAFGRRTKELLERSGASVTYREYEMGHQISEESLNDLMAWLTACIDAK